MGNRHGGEKAGAAKEEKEEKRRKKKEKKAKKKQKQKKAHGGAAGGGVGSDVDLDPESSQFSRADSESLVFHSAENLSPYLDASTRSEEGAAGCAMVAGVPYDNGHILSSKDFHDGFSIEACLPADLAASSAMMMMMTSSDISTDTGSHRAGGGDDVTSMSSGVYGTPLLSSPDVRRGIPRSPLAARQKDSFCEPVPPIPSDFSSNTLSSSASYQEGVSTPGSGSSTHRSTSSRASSSTVDTNAAHCIERLEELERNIERTIIEKFAAMDHQHQQEESRGSSENTTPRLARRDHHFVGGGERSREGSMTPKGVRGSGGPAQSAENSPALLRKISESSRPTLVREGSTTPVGIIQGMWSQSAENSPVIVRKALPQPESPIILRRTPSQSPSVERKFPANAPESPVFYRRAIPSLDSPSLSPSTPRRAPTEDQPKSPQLVCREGLDHEPPGQSPPKAKVPPPVPPKPVMKTLTSPEIARRLQNMPKSPIMPRKVYTFQDQQTKDSKSSMHRDDAWDRRWRDQQQQHQMPPKSPSRSPEVRHRVTTAPSSVAARKTPSSSPSPKSLVRKLMPGEDRAPPPPTAAVSATKTAAPGPTHIQFCHQQRGIPVKQCTVLPQHSSHAVVLHSTPDEDARTDPRAASRPPDTVKPSQAAPSVSASPTRFPDPRQSHARTAAPQSASSALASGPKQSLAHQTPAPPSQREAAAEVSEDAIKRSTESAVFGSVSPKLKRQRRILSGGGGSDDTGWQSGSSLDHVRGGGDSTDSSTRSPPCSPPLQRSVARHEGREAPPLHASSGSGEGWDQSPAERRRVLFQKQNSKCREDGTISADIAGGLTYHAHLASDDVDTDQGEGGTCHDDSHRKDTDVRSGENTPSFEQRGARPEEEERNHSQQPGTLISDNVLPHTTAEHPSRKTALQATSLPGRAVIEGSAVAWKNARDEEDWQHAGSCYTDTDTGSHGDRAGGTHLTASSTRTSTSASKRREGEEAASVQSNTRCGREKEAEEEEHRVITTPSSCQLEQQKPKKKRVPSPPSCLQPTRPAAAATTTTASATSGSGSASSGISDDNFSGVTTKPATKNLGQLIRDAIIHDSSSPAPYRSEVLTTAELSSSSSVGEKDDSVGVHAPFAYSTEGNIEGIASHGHSAGGELSSQHPPRPFYSPTSARGNQRGRENSPAESSSTSSLSSPSSLRRAVRIPPGVVRKEGGGAGRGQHYHSVVTQPLQCSNIPQPLASPQSTQGRQIQSSDPVPHSLVVSHHVPVTTTPTLHPQHGVTPSSIPTPPHPPSPPLLDTGTAIRRIDIDVNVILPPGDESQEGDNITPTFTSPACFSSPSADQYPLLPPNSGTESEPEGHASGIMDRDASDSSTSAGGIGTGTSPDQDNPLPSSSPPHAAVDNSDAKTSVIDTHNQADNDNGDNNDETGTRIEKGATVSLPPPPSPPPPSSSSSVAEYTEEIKTPSVMEKPTDEEHILPTAAAEGKNASDYKKGDKQQGVKLDSAHPPFTPPFPSPPAPSMLESLEHEPRERSSAEGKKESVAATLKADSCFPSESKSKLTPEVSSPSRQERQETTNDVQPASRTEPSSVPSKPVPVSNEPVEVVSMETILREPDSSQNTASPISFSPQFPPLSAGDWSQDPQTCDSEGRQHNGAGQPNTSIADTIGTRQITQPMTDTMAQQAESTPQENVPPPSPTAMDTLAEEEEEEEEEEDVNCMINAHQDSDISSKISQEMQLFGETVVRRLSSLLESQASESDSCLEEGRSDLLSVPGSRFGRKQDDESSRNLPLASPNQQQPLLDSLPTADLRSVEETGHPLMLLETGLVQHIPGDAAELLPKDSVVSEESGPGPEKDVVEPTLHEELNTFAASDLPGERLVASDTTETLSTTDHGDTTSASSKRESTTSTATDETLTSFKTRSNTDSAEYEDAFILPESLVFVRSVNEGEKEKGAVVESGRIIKRPPIPAELTRRCVASETGPADTPTPHPKPRKKRRRQMASYDISARADVTEPEPKRGSKQIEEVIDAYCEDMSENDDSVSSSDISSSDADDILKDELIHRTTFPRSEQQPRLPPDLHHRDIVRKPKPPADRSTDSEDDSGGDLDAKRQSSSSHDSSFRIPEIEETFGELMGVKTFLEDLEDKTPTSELPPELAGGSSSGSGGGGACGGDSPEDRLQSKEYQPSMSQHRRRSKTSPARTDRTESDLDVSEHRDDASTDSMYADDEDEGAELVFQKSYSEEHGGEVVLSCTIYNSAQHDKDGNDSDDFWADADGAADAAGGAAAAAASSDANYKTLETAADAAGSAFRNARIQMHDIHQHLQDLRRQMELLQDDITSTSLTLTPEFSLESEQRPVTE